MKRCVLLLIVLTGLASCGISPKDNISHQSPAGDSSWYSVRFHALCDGKERREVSFDKVVKYDTYIPYDTVRAFKMDSVIISFDFIADCCLTFSGRAEVLNDTLFLRYGLDGEYVESCGCFCDYRLSYRINKKNLTWSGMKIIHKEMIFKE